MRYNVVCLAKRREYLSTRKLDMVKMRAKSICMGIVDEKNKDKTFKTTYISQLI